MLPDVKEKTAGKTIFKVVSWGIFVILLLVLFLVASPILPTRDFVSTHAILTGSMEPDIKAGAIVFSTNSKLPQVNDVIVFPSPTVEDTVIVHRIVEVDEDGNFKTKGDNNDDPDNWFVTKDNVLGTVVLSIPYLGYVIDWMHSPVGFILLIVIPALIYAYSQIKKISSGIEEEVDRKVKAEVEKIKEQETKPPTLILLFLISAYILFSRVDSAYAYFVDSVEISGITISTMPAEEEQAGPVVINEIMWSGTSLSEDDQWIELRNMTDKDLNIGKWTIENARGPGKPALMIPANRIIPANGYFLIGNHPEQSANTLIKAEVNQSNASIELTTEENGNIVLKNSEGEIVDQALESPTIVEDFYSVQRNDDPGDGLDLANWTNCTDPLCTDDSYWKPSETETYGTPGGQNIY